MSTLCTHFEAYFTRWRGEAGALCYLLTRNRADMQHVLFQSFLRLGAAKDPEIGEDDARALLFASVVRLSRDYFVQKMRKFPSRKRFGAQSLPFPATDALYALLRLPFNRRAALALAQFGFAPADIARALGVSERRVAALTQPPSIPGWQEAIASVALTEDEALLLNDRIYERFAERSVGVENAIHDLRSAFDRVAPYLALAVLALFAFSVWYVSR